LLLLNLYNHRNGMNKRFFGIGLLLVAINISAQTNSLNIGSSLQSITDPTSVFNAWQIIDMSPAMQTAPCYQTTTSGQAPSPGLQPVPPVDLTNGPQPAYVVYNNGLSCFPFNTIYTPFVNTTNVTNYSATFRRSFFICGNTSADVNFAFDILCDDYIQTIRLDENTTFTINRYSINPHVFFNQTVSLAPGLHTIDIKASNWQNPGGQYYTVQGSSMQWNPFAFSITGTVSTAASVLFNYPANTNCVLPVKLVGFTAVKTGSQVNVNWTAVTEENVSSYEIEKSTDGLNFYTIGAIRATANSAVEKKYSFSDENPGNTENIYYRIQAIDVNGTKTYSTIAVVRLIPSKMPVSIQPNPFNNELTLTVTSSQNNRGEIIITDASGSTVRHLFVNFQKGHNQQQVNVAALSAGVYFVKIKNGPDQAIIKSVKAR
jgi:Secretion system C-terminal sorting domain